MKVTSSFETSQSQDYTMSQPTILQFDYYFLAPTSPRPGLLAN